MDKRLCENFFSQSLFASFGKRLPGAVDSGENLCYTGGENRKGADEMKQKDVLRQEAAKSAMGKR